ncbi:MAG: hypothetical protein WC479_07795 [Candidatus Izemoplasmatales bacterium]|jgi:hypothetical protein
MALRNLKYYVRAISQNRNAAVLQQIQFEANTDDPTDADLAAGRLHYKDGVGFRGYTGSQWITFGSGGTGSNNWDDIYANDKTLTIDSTTLTFALTHATNDGLTITGSAGSSGDCIQITNSGSGNDIQGTSNTWAVTKAGAATLVSIAGCDSLTAAANLVLEATGAGTISVGATSTGAIDIGTGGGAVTLASAVTCSSSLTVATGITNSDGLVDLIDNSNAASTLRVTNDTQSTYGNASDAGMIVFRSETISTGALLHLTLDETNLAGGAYLRCWGQDAGAAVFSIKEYGATVIAGTAAGTAVLTLTLGDLVVEDSDASKFESEDGTTTLLTLDNKAGVIADNSAVLLVDAGGAVASGGNALRVAFTGAAAAGAILAEFLPDAGSLGVKVDGGGLATDVALYVDADPTAVGLAYLHSDAVMANNHAILEIDHATGASASGSNLFRIYEAATPNAGAIMFEMDVQKDCAAVYIDSDSATNDAFTLTGQGAIATTKTMLRVSNTGTPAAADSYLAVFDYSGITATNNPVAVRMLGVGTAQTLEIVHTTGAGANNKGVLSVTTSGATAAGGSVLRVTGTGTPAAATSYLLDFDYSGATMTNNPVTMYLNSGSSTGAAVYVTGSGAGYSLATYMTGTGATGVQWFTEHTSTGSAADNDVVFSLLLGGLSDTDVARQYGAIKVTAIDVSNETEDAKLDLQVMVAGTLTSLLYVQSSTAGATTMACAAAASTFTGSAAGTAAITVTNGDISLSAGKFISTTTADIYGLDVTVNKATATQGVAVFTNASATSAKAVLELEQADLDQPYMKFSGSTAVTSANAGANGDVPAQVVGYLLVDVDGTNRKIPYYAS